MPNPYQEDQNRTGAPRYESRGSHPDQYRRGDAPFQFPLWSIIVTFCVGMWPWQSPSSCSTTCCAAACSTGNRARAGSRLRPRPPRRGRTSLRPSRKNPRARTARSPPLWSRGCVLLGVGAIASVSGLHDMIFYGGLNIGTFTSRMSPCRSS